MFKMVKWGLIGGAALILAGGLFFGRELFSYANSSRKMIQSTVKDAIPVQFEIQRARDLLEELVPEMHANLRLVAHEEVEVAHLEKEVADDRESLASERGNIQSLRRKLDGDGASTLLTSADGDKELVDNLSQRFERFRTQEMLLAGKVKLLENRRKSLHAAIQRLEKTRLARIELAAQIEALEGQFRLIQAQGAANDLRIDTSKLAQTQKLLTDLRKRLEVAQRVLEREARYTDPAPVSTVSAQSLAEEIDGHFAKGRPAPAVGSTAGAAPSVR